MWYLDILLNFHELDAGRVNRITQEYDAARLQGSPDFFEVARARGGDTGCRFETLDCCKPNLRNSG